MGMVIVLLIITALDIDLLTSSLRNRKHALCFYRVIQTQVEV